MAKSCTSKNNNAYDLNLMYLACNPWSGFINIEHTILQYMLEDGMFFKLDVSFPKEVLDCENDTR